MLGTDRAVRSTAVILLAGALAGAALLGATPALADPCRAPLPNRAGQVFSGQVRYVGDGDSLCIGPTSDPATWIEVRLADFDAPELSAPGGREAKARLQALTIRRPLRCTAVRGRQGAVTVYDRVIGACTLEGRPVGDLLRAQGGPRGGR